MCAYRSLQLRHALCQDSPAEEFVMTSRTTFDLGLIYLLTACALYPASAYADQPADESTDENDQDHTVKTVAPDETSVDDRRFPSGFVTRIEVDDELRHGRDLADALERVAGVSVQRSSSLGRPAFASVRGGNSRQLSVSLNGMRISAPAGLGFDVGSLSLAGIDAVDVFRGSAGTVHGGGALSGALDLRTSLPEGVEGWRASGTALGGSYETFGTQAHTAVIDKSYAARLDASWRQSDGDFEFVDAQGTTHQRLNNDHQQLGLLASGRLDIGQGRLESLAMYQQGEGGAPGPSEYQTQFDQARLAHRRVIGQMGWNKRNLAVGSWGAIDARALAGYQRRTTDYENPTAFPGDSEVHDATTLDAFELDVQTSAFFDVGDILHVGLEGRQEAYQATHRVIDADGVAVSPTDAARRTLAAMVSNELLLADQAVSLIAGLRLEHVDEIDRRSWTPLIPSAGAIWRAKTWLKFKANAARTFRAPDFDELYLDMVGVRGDPSLEPERAISVDAGVKLGGAQDPVSLEAVYFRNELAQSIYFVAQTAYLTRAANLGSGTSQGVETMLSWRPVERVDVAGTYTFTDARLDGMAAGVYMPAQPRHRAGARAEVEMAGLGYLEGLQSLRLFGEGRWRSQIFLDSFGNISNAPFWTADLGAAFAPLDWVEVTINARNLADNRRGVGTLQRPLSGRAFYGSLTVEFGGLE
jgi:iron complex outermembrane receptor protein